MHLTPITKNTNMHEMQIKWKISHRWKCQIVPFLQSRCLFHWCSSAKSVGSLSSICFMLLCFMLHASGIFFGLTSRQMETREICVPAFAWPWKSACNQESWSTWATSVRKRSVVLQLIIQWFVCGPHNQNRLYYAYLRK